MTLVVLAGPTGSGKSELAIRLAASLHGEIVNYDSVQIYRGFDIGSAKPSLQIRQTTPHHLFDVIEPDAELNAVEYARMARAVCEDILARTKRPILAGGTFFYLRVFLSGLPEMPGRQEAIRSRLQRIAAANRGRERLHRWLRRVDPVSATRISPADRHRLERALEVWIAAGQPISSWKRPGEESSPELPAIKIGLQIARPLLHERLERRVDRMYEAGLIEETRQLLRRYPRDARPFGTIGYREAVAVIEGRLDLHAAMAETKRRTRAYAKRQMTWLRSERNVQWVEASDPEKAWTAAMRLVGEVRA